MANFKLIVRNVHVYTNLEVRLKSRTMKEQANKEVERMVDFLYKKINHVAVI